MIEHWVYLRCACIRLAQYTDIWIFHLHKESRLITHTYITPPHPPRPWPATTATTQDTCPTGLVKPKPNRLTLPQAKHTLHLHLSPHARRLH